MPGTVEALDTYRRRIAAVAPDLAVLPLTIMAGGWDSVAVDAGGEWVFKFPRTPDAATRLAMEARLLALVRAHVRLRVPEMTFCAAEQPFSMHRKIPGRSLETADYMTLSSAQRDALAETLAEFFAQLHTIPLPDAVAAGAGPAEPWLAPEVILDRLRPTLPPHLGGFLEATMRDYAARGDPGPAVYSHLDGHGWNMAFDHDAGRLNGIFDFADSGIATPGLDLSYPAFVSRELALAVTHRYSRTTGRTVDPALVLLYAATLRFHELADAAGSGSNLRTLEAWLAGP